MPSLVDSKMFLLIKGILRPEDLLLGLGFQHGQTLIFLILMETKFVTHGNGNSSMACKVSVVGA